MVNLLRDNWEKVALAAIVIGWFAASFLPDVMGRF